MTTIDRRFVFAVLAYVLPTFPLGYVWHLVLFQDFYASLAVYRADIIVPLGVASMLIQGIAWAYLYSRLFASESVLAGALKFAALAVPLAGSFLVLAISAKHHMSSVSGFLMIESAFLVLQYLIVSPLIALAFAYRPAAPAR